MSVSKIIVALLGGLILLSCSAPKGATDTSRTDAIKKLIAFFESRTGKTEFGTVRYYQNGSNAEIICEARFSREPDEVWTDEKVRSRALEMLGTYFTVGEIRNYGRLGISFTLKGVGPSGGELYQGTARFDEVLRHYNGHNF